MARESQEDALARFEKNPRNHADTEWLGLLKLLGWTLRKEATKHYVLSRGRRTLTLSKCHGSNKVVPIKMAATVLREIELASLAEESPDDE